MTKSVVFWTLIGTVVAHVAVFFIVVAVDDFILFRDAYRYAVTLGIPLVSLAVALGLQHRREGLRFAATSVIVLWVCGFAWLHGQWLNVVIGSV